MFISTLTNANPKANIAQGTKRGFVGTIKSTIAAGATLLFAASGAANAKIQPTKTQQHNSPTAEEAKTAHIIISHPHVYNSAGKLGHALAKITQEELAKQGYTFTVTDLNEPYKIEEEGKRFFQSSLIIFHFPMFWFYPPGQLKDYMDQVYVGASLFGPSSGAKYGSAGKLVGKKYIIATTMNVQEEAFKSSQLLKGMTVDDVYTGFHIAQRYIGLKHAGTISHHDVIHGDTSAVPNNHKNKISKLLQKLN